jgi:muconolactone delta-isomerase
MKQYIIDIQLPEVITEDFVSMIPDQRRVVDKLFLEGKIHLYSLAFDRSKLWVGMNAESEAEVWNILYTFPLIEYMNADIHELAFHNAAKTGIYELSLN